MGRGLLLGVAVAAFLATGAMAAPLAFRLLFNSAVYGPVAGGN